MPVTAVAGVDLAILPGQHVAIVGPSGSGKSTLLGLMGLLISPTAGDVAVDGASTVDCDDRAMSELRQRKVGFVFQQFHLLPYLDAAGNVELALLRRGLSPDERRQKVLDCLNRVGLADRVGHRPGELSGGEQQRVAIARAMAPKPRLLLADEPSGNLDSSTRDDVLALLADVRSSGTTVVVVTHDADVAAGADRRVEVVDGVVRGDP